MWLVLYWGALLYGYAEKRERIVLAAGLVGLALVPPLFARITAANIEQRSPLFVAALDLAERREDASAEDGLRQASAVFPEDSDVWFLLGIYAERSGDLERAQSDYGRAMQADPADYRPILNRGNVHFTEGDYGEAIRDYIEAARRSPRSAEIFYNLSLARGEAYDFDGQAAAIAQAREISASQVTGWTDNPTLSRVVPAGYPLDRARARLSGVERPAQEPPAAGPRQRAAAGGSTSRGGPFLRSSRSLLGASFARAWRRRRRRRRVRSLRTRLLQPLPPLRRSVSLLRGLLSAPHREGGAWTSRSRSRRPRRCSGARAGSTARAGSPRCCCPGPTHSPSERPIARRG